MAGELVLPETEAGGWKTGLRLGAHLLLLLVVVLFGCFCLGGRCGDEKRLRSAATISA